MRMLPVTLIWIVIQMEREVGVVLRELTPLA